MISTPYVWKAPEEPLCGIGNFSDNILQFIYPKRDTKLTQIFGVPLHMCHNQFDILLNLTCVILSHMCHNGVLQQTSQPPLCHRITQKLKLIMGNLLVKIIQLNQCLIHQSYSYQGLQVALSYHNKACTAQICLNLLKKAQHL